MTELGEKGSLADVLKQYGKLTENQARRYLMQIIKGYQEIAENSVVHRDLKPSNLFVSGQDEILIGDFGLATTLSEESDGVAGSPYYMAPEIVDTEEKTKKYSF